MNQRRTGQERKVAKPCSASRLLCTSDFRRREHYFALPRPAYTTFLSRLWRNDEKRIPAAARANSRLGIYFPCYFIPLLSLRWRSQQLADGNARNDSRRRNAGQRAMKRKGNDTSRVTYDVSYVSDTRAGEPTILVVLSHYSRPTRQLTFTRASRFTYMFRTCPVFRTWLVQIRRVKRDSLPDITRKANAALSHRWRVISNPRFSPSSHWSFPLSFAQFSDAQHSRTVRLRFPFLFASELRKRGGKHGGSLWQRATEN